MKQKQLYWQRVRGVAILSVVFIHCQSGIHCSYDSFNGISYFILRNIVNFPVAMFFFLSGYFLKPIDSKMAFYKKRLPRLIIPYCFYTCAYLGMGFVSGKEITIKRIMMAFLLGTASTPLYYIVVLAYFTLFAPFLLKAIQSKKASVIIFLTSAAFILIAYLFRFAGIDVWNYLKYTPAWLLFYYLGMIIKRYKPTFKKSLLWILLSVSFISELISTALLSKVDSSIAYSQLRFSGIFYSLILILLAYEYSKNQKNSDTCKWLSALGDDSYAIYYMHCASLIIFSKVFTYQENMILPVYQFVEMIFAILVCEIVIFIIRKINNPKLQMIFGV